MDHGHGHDPEGMGDGRLIAAVAVNLLLTLAQVIGGVVSGSLALVADALHNLNDAASLGIALVARRISRRPADRRRTFGYQRAETIGALINLTTLIVVGLYLVYEAIARYFEDQVIDGWIVVIVAGFALAVDIVTALLTYAGARQSLNIRAAFVHNISDALASVGVIAAGTLILLYDLTIADLLVTILISVYILYQGFTMIGEAIQVLMEGTPEDIRLNDVVTRMLEVEGVGDVHHVHIWQLGEQTRALEAHIVLATPDLETIEPVKQRLRRLLTDSYDIAHCTLEIELHPAPAHDTEVVAEH
jgi:cobalt-zinc-cadmium efflux system protein